MSAFWGQPMQQAVAWLRKGGELVATGHATHTLQLCEKQDYLRHSVITDRGTPSFECIAVASLSYALCAAATPLIGELVLCRQAIHAARCAAAAALLSLLTQSHCMVFAVAVDDPTPPPAKLAS
jgi:hypothetical protein